MKINLTLPSDTAASVPRGIFITGTDTGVGKTLVAAGLVRLLASHGKRVVGLKPVASGAEQSAGGLRNDDALALSAGSTVALPYELTNPYCFAPAIAPHLAAREAGIAISVDALSSLAPALRRRSANEPASAPTARKLTTSMASR